MSYVYDCHVLVHEDAGMMGQFTVVEADEVDDARSRITGDEADSHEDHDG